MFAYFNTINWPMVYVNFDLKQLSDESFEKYTIDYLAILIKAQTEKIKLILVYNLDNMKSKSERHPMISIDEILKDKRFFENG